ncbi:hypothetical protein FEM48_Zijuj04G0190500 [Ziziphus jujuba var. spinosa]|uniref:Cysteine-rich receptor-like protein kinase 10 n=1 Tax=Ziziphus jujuba var. spinosa TaxID=714518 RepID=A0A978VLM3_ZIZJJ|nr:hypothetical protein FEM48_Zijuj04G0190500 [Ziziphus jujuba var. spinosa]
MTAPSGYMNVAVPIVIIWSLIRLSLSTEANLEGHPPCMVRYLNESFFGRMERKPAITFANSQEIADKLRFIQLIQLSMNDSMTRAVNTPPGAKKYATKEANFSASETLFSLVQCTPDLNSSDCDECLRELFSSIPGCCYGQRGAYLLNPSCNMRFEIYPFYEFTAAPTPAPMLVPMPVLVPPPPTGSKDGNEITTVESLQFDLSAIKAATDNFSDVNKLGERGFGEVFKGTLPNGQHIAAKRLSRSSRQGAEEFKTEVLFVAMLQHKNLARLLGFCLEGEEKILVYEFVPNKSLDHFLGYMPPEYAFYGQFSVKSDVYSFGVLILEIITGKKNSSFLQSDGAMDLLSYVWKHWRDGTILEILDPSFGNSYSRNAVIRCIQIGLLCVEEDPADRPTIATIVLMSSTYSLALALPRKPAFFPQPRTDRDIPSIGIESDKSASQFKSTSINDMSISESFPR